MANTVNDERKPGRKIYISMSDDAKRWSEPVSLIEEPLEAPKSFQTQPTMLNYKEKELWCFWRFVGGEHSELGSVHLSRLKAGADNWVHQAIPNTLAIDGESLLAYPSQNPVLLESGRVLVPVTFISERDPIQTHIRKKDPVRYNGVLYTDNSGKTWNVSNGVSLPIDATSQWEPCVHEQIDGKLRMFYRNMSRTEVPPTRWMCTTVGKGSKKGTPVIFEPDAHYSIIETANCRMQTIKLSSARYAMFHHDTYTRRFYEGRTGGSVFFSRTGMDDFVAGPGFSESSKDIVAYPQGIEHDGKIYVLYTLGMHITHVRDIQVAELDPAPAADKYYIWPRDKDINKLTVFDKETKQWLRTNKDYKYTRPYKVNKDGRESIVFEERGSAGVEINPVDFTKGQSLKFSFDVKISHIQDYGNLILCSFGDLVPIRIGVPSNRKDHLYAWSANQWQDVGAIKHDKWQHLTIIFGDKKFSIKIDNVPSKDFRNPGASPTPRLYLGDGYEIDGIESNRGSKFFIDLKSLTTHVQ
jgi:hypothetical protein